MSDQPYDPTQPEVWLRCARAMRDRNPDMPAYVSPAISLPPGTTPRTVSAHHCKPLHPAPAEDLSQLKRFWADGDEEVEVSILEPLMRDHAATSVSTIPRHEFLYNCDNSDQDPEQITRLVTPMYTMDDDMMRFYKNELLVMLWYMAVDLSQGIQDLQSEADLGDKELVFSRPTFFHETRGFSRYMSAYVLYLLQPKPEPKEDAPS